MEPARTRGRLFFFPLVHLVFVWRQRGQLFHEVGDFPQLVSKVRDFKLHVIGVFPDRGLLTPRHDGGRVFIDDFHGHLMERQQVIPESIWITNARAEVVDHLDGRQQATRIEGGLQVFEFGAIDSAIGGLERAIAVQGISSSVRTPVVYG